MAMTRSVHNNAPDALAFVHQVESAGAAGKITVSEAIYHRTKDLFDFEPRGGVESNQVEQLHRRHRKLHRPVDFLNAHARVD